MTPYSHRPNNGKAIRGRRAVSPIIATILLVAITVVLAAVLYVLISGLTRGPEAQPIGSALALGPVKETSSGTNYWYNFSVASARSGITWSSVQLRIVSPTGPVTTGITSYQIVDISNHVLLTSAGPVESSWTAGTSAPSATITSTQSVSILCSVDIGHAGDQLVAVGLGAFSGTAQANIS